MIVQLDLLRNGLHSLYHGVEHLQEALDSEEDSDLHMYGPGSGLVVHRASSGAQSWSLTAFSRPPRTYALKFAILHFIQAVELIVKARLAQLDPQAIFDRPGSKRTITLWQAIKKLSVTDRALLDPGQNLLLARTGDLRNAIEHSEFSFDLLELKETTVDFLALSCFLASRLHGLNVPETFQFDAYRNGQDRVGDTISAILATRTSRSDTSVVRIAEEWLAQHPNDRLLRCFSCDTRSISFAEQRCVVCGADGDLEGAELADEFEELAAAVAKLRSAQR